MILPYFCSMASSLRIKYRVSCFFVFLCVCFVDQEETGTRFNINIISTYRSRAKMFKGSGVVQSGFESPQSINALARREKEITSGEGHYTTLLNIFLKSGMDC